MPEFKYFSSPGQEKDLKHFHTSLLVNEEDANGLLNIKQEALSRYLLIEKRRSGNEWLSAMLIPLYNVVQANTFGSR